MSKTKEFDRIAEECSELIIDKVYKTCDFALTGEDELIENVDFNEAHSYLMQLVLEKIKNKIK
jgi:hypothetical protein